MDAGTLKLTDSDIYYEIHGRGNPLLLLHGGMASLREWDSIVTPLAEYFQVIAYDRAGVGRSTGRAFERDMVSEGVQELDAVVRHFGFERVSLYGSCIGGAIALSFATEWQARVRSVLTTGALFRGSEELRQRLARIFRPWSGMPRPFQEAMQRVYGGDKVEARYEQFRQVYVKSEPVGYASSPDYDIRGVLPRITCPVLTVHGDRDPFWGVEQPAAAYPLMLNAALWVLPRCGHYPHVEYPRVLATEAANFFGSSQ